MTFGEVSAAALAELPAERARLEELAAEGLVAFARDGAMRVTPLGRLFVRNVAMVFDAYLGEEAAGRRVFSQTV